MAVDRSWRLSRAETCEYPKSSDEFMDLIIK